MHLKTQLKMAEKARGLKYRADGFLETDIHNNYGLAKTLLLCLILLLHVFLFSVKLTPPFARSVSSGPD